MVFFEKHGFEEKEFFQTIELKNYDFPPHFHRAYELIYINDGSITLTIDQREYHLKKNDLAFIFPNQIHEFKNFNHSEITVILFSQELIGDFYLNYKGYIPVDNILHLEGGLDTEKLNSVYSQKSFLYSLCADLIRNKTFSPVKQSPQMTVLYKILVYVEQNYTEECTLRSVAKYLQYD
ncbi:MAG TPA: AraC family ligand binding domain-containing protein, partial [Lachnospiraceae bacterium]|nr:AraC family ligand binding domain-containing protein [Lachnospiraceae bacterium]